MKKNNTILFKTADVVITTRDFDNAFKIATKQFCEDKQVSVSRLNLLASAWLTNDDSNRRCKTRDAVIAYLDLDPDYSEDYNELNQYLDFSESDSKNIVDELGKAIYNAFCVFSDAE